MIRLGEIFCFVIGLAFVSTSVIRPMHGHGSGHENGHGGGHGGGPGGPVSCSIADFQVQNDFDIGRFVGTWYTIEHTQNTTFPYQRRSHYSLNANGGLGMTTYRITEQDGCDSPTQFEADANLPDGATNSAKLFLQPRGISVPPEDYWVVYTDYVDHALVYSCKQQSGDGSCQAGADRVWFLARVGGLSHDAHRHMMSLLRGLCMDAARITHVPTDCDDVLGVPTPLPHTEHHHVHGCTVDNFHTMENFDKIRYTGTWYVIAHLQDGVYPYHRISYYSLDHEGSFIMGTHRITSPGDCPAAWKFEGQAYLPDNSEVDSKFQLRPFGMAVYGEPYWIIYTDYVDHSLVYSCREQAADGTCREGAMHAWLLSRNGTLTSEARSHMEMLLTDMCVDTSDLVDTPDECDSVLGVDTLTKPEASNQCVVEGFQTMEPFNKTRYAGTWYVISHLQDGEYPFQRVSHYTLEDDGSLTMATDRINGANSCGSAMHFEATASQSPDSPLTSKMVLKPKGMDIEGDDYWVVYTDYVDHTLIYSCGTKNLDGTCLDGTVKTWLLSRSPRLSDIAHSHMVSLLRRLCISPMHLNDIPKECDAELGVAQISKCDVSRFDVKENFDLSQYMGIWYVVSHLPDTATYHRISHYRLDRDGTSVVMATDHVSGPGECATAQHFEVRATQSKKSSAKAKLVMMPIGIPSNGDDYWVIEANYTDHALVYTCSKRNLDGTCVSEDTHAYMLSRRPTLSPETRQHLDALLTDLCIDPTEMVDTPTECDAVLEAEIQSHVAQHSSTSCVVDELPLMDDFDINQNEVDQIKGIVSIVPLDEYVGVWYTVSQIQPFDYPFHRVSNYTMQSNGRLLMSTNHFYRPGQCATMQFEAEAFHRTPDGQQLNNSRSPKLILQPLNNMIPPGNYWVAYTDYTDHALVYSCAGKNEDGTCKRGRGLAWFMSRNPTLTQAAVAHMEHLLTQMCVDPARLKDVIRDCDEEIGIFTDEDNQCSINDFSVKDDLIIEKFMGDWYELHHTKGGSLMPLPDNEKMTLTRPLSNNDADIAITMKNIQLNGACQNRDMAGSGWLGQINPAKMVVSFPLIPAGYNVPSVVNFWVLDTDYVNYAVTYTCHRANLDGSCDRHAQALWVLGRGRVIAPEHWATVQRVIREACIDPSTIQPNPDPCSFRSPQTLDGEPRSCDTTEFGCCMLSDEAATDAQYTNCPRVAPPVAGRVIPEANFQVASPNADCEHNINCKMFCRFGFKRDSNNCEICECSLEPQVSVTPEGKTSKISNKPESS